MHDVIDGQLQITNLARVEEVRLPQSHRVCKRRAWDSFCYVLDGKVDYHMNGGSSFTLQNGEEKLRVVFSDVQRLLYEDALEVTNVEDMVDYIRSLTGMSELRNLPRDEIRPVLEKNMTGGVLRVPKEYGMFIAR